MVPTKWFRSTKAQPAARRRPSLEALEDRCLLSITPLLPLPDLSDPAPVGDHVPRHERTVTWLPHGGAQEVVLLIPTDFDNVKPYIPPEHWDRIVTTPVGGEELATLGLVFNEAPENSVTSSLGTFTAQDKMEVQVTVLYSTGDPADAYLEFQSYGLARLTNWRELDAAYQSIGLPSEYVPDLRFDVSVDPVTGLGSYQVDVPWPRSPFTASGQITAQGVPFDGDAADFTEGRYGLVRVNHHSHVGLGNASGTITAQKTHSAMADWLGATSAEGGGFYLDVAVDDHTHTGFVAEPRPSGPAGASLDTAATTWSVQIGTAPNALTNAAGMPQDIHLTATGNNAEGWHGAGVTTLLGNLAQFLDFGQRAVLQADIVQGGLIGIDGTPVLPGTYLAPSPQLGDRTFEVVSGRTFYLIVDFTVVNSNITDSVVGPIPVGTTYRVMLTFDAVEGRSEQPLVEWLDFGGGFFPFVNEGVMSTNLRLG